MASLASGALGRIDDQTGVIIFIARFHYCVTNFYPSFPLLLYCAKFESILNFLDKDTEWVAGPGEHQTSSESYSRQSFLVPEKQFLNFGFPFQ